MKRKINKKSLVNKSVAEICKELNISVDSLIELKQQEYRRKTADAKHTQQWREYNQAQTKEKLLFYKLLDELLDLVPQRTYTFGRPRKSLRDMVFCCMIKTYANTSSRRIISDLELAKRANYIQEVPHFNTVLNYFDDSGMRMLLHYLIRISSLPLKQVENVIAIDSTGFGTGRFDRWLEVRNKFNKLKRGYVKAHICCGVKTNIVTSAEITSARVADTTMFESLTTQTAEEFDMKEICADKGYSSKQNIEIAKKLGAMPYIPFKKNVTGKAGGSYLWAQMYDFYAKNYIKFAEHYHKRSNVESTFSMIKKKFGDFVRCKTERSQTNEVLCKLLAHNIVVLIHEMFELKVEIDFKKAARKHPAQKVI